MRTTITIAIVLGVVVGVAGRLALRGNAGSSEKDAAAAAARFDASADQVAANGTVEPARPEMALRPQTAGAITRLLVRENEQVAAGAVLAELSNETQKAQVLQARAKRDSALANLAKLRNGALPEEKNVAAAEEQSCKVAYDAACGELDRALAGGNSVSRQEMATQRTSKLRAKAGWDKAKAQLELVRRGPREEDVAAARSQADAAEADLKFAEAELAKTSLKAPIGGCVLQIFAEAGEAASPTSPQPVLILADLSHRRVRAFVEELDVARVTAGQQAVVTADGLSGKSFAGKVATVLPRMGKRAPQSDTPGEYKDMYYREVLIDLDDANELPLNLRVQVRIPGKQ